MSVLNSDFFIKQADEAINYANKIAFESFSKNMLNMSAMTIETSSEFSQLSSKFEQLAKLKKKLLAATTPVEWDTSPPKDRESEAYATWAKAWFDASIAASKQMGVGNCEALALLSLEYLSQNLPDNVSIEVFHCVNDKATGTKKDHVFLVIGRDTSKSANNIDDWGENAVICDPWAKKSYPATKANMKENLEYITTTFHGPHHEQRNTLQKFNPETDKLKATITNKMITEDFVARSKEIEALAKENRAPVPKITPIPAEEDETVGLYDDVYDEPDKKPVPALCFKGPHPKKPEEGPEGPEEPGDSPKAPKISKP